MSGAAEHVPLGCPICQQLDQERRQRELAYATALWMLTANLLAKEAVRLQRLTSEADTRWQEVMNDMATHQRTHARRAVNLAGAPTFRKDL